MSGEELDKLEQFVGQKNNFISNGLTNRRINSEIKDGQTALHLASSKGQLEAVKILSATDAIEIDAKDNKNRTALHLASRAGHTAIAAYLIEKGADIHAITEDQCTPLHLASVYHRPEIVKLLLKHNADIDTKAPNGETALQRLAEALRKGVPVWTLEDTEKVCQLLGQKRAEKMKAADACLICMDEFTDADAPQPNHVRCEECFQFYHRVCIEIWYVKGTKTCPNCREYRVIV